MFEKILEINSITFRRPDANSGGYCNTITLVSRKVPPSSLQAEEPLRLLIRRKGGNVADVDSLGINTDASQTLIQYEMSRRGLGPTIYGIVHGGTIEEYIDSHTLTSEESADPETSNDIALSLAAIHAIKGLPLRTNVPEHNLNKQREWIKNKLNARNYLLNNETLKKFNLDFEFWSSFDYETEINWIQMQLSSLPMRKNFILYDMNYLNCLVRSKPKEDQMRVVLIDYDISHIGHRGIDLGCHFFYRRFNFQSEDKNLLIPNSTFPSDAEKREFLRIYQQEIKRLNVWPDFDENGIDSIDNLLLESTIGQMQFVLYFTCCMINKPEGFFDSEPSMAPCFEFYIRQYLIFKEHVLRILQ